MAKILVSGCAGFIGFHRANRVLEQGAEVVGLDNLRCDPKGSKAIATDKSTSIPVCQNGHFR